MNTASRTISIRNTRRAPRVRTNQATVTPQQGIIGIFFIVVALLSAFSLVYTKDLARRLFILDQTVKTQNVVENEKWSKLLLEQSTLSTQARVQRMAQNKLGMILPDFKNTRLITVNDPRA